MEKDRLKQNYITLVNIFLLLIKKECLPLSAPAVYLWLILFRQANSDRSNKKTNYFPLPVLAGNNELAEMLNVSRFPFEKARKELIDNGYIVYFPKRYRDGEYYLLDIVTMYEQAKEKGIDKDREKLKAFFQATAKLYAENVQKKEKAPTDKPEQQKKLKDISLLAELKKLQAKKGVD